MLQRIERGTDYVTRRVHPQKAIRDWTNIQCALDTRKHGKKARASDIYLHLIHAGLEAIKQNPDFVFRPMAQNEPGLVVQFPKHFYSEFERLKDEIKAGKWSKQGTGTIKIMDIILCLMQEGHTQIFSQSKKR